jgi:hypothetical protein
MIAVYKYLNWNKSLSFSYFLFCTLSRFLFLSQSFFLLFCQLLHHLFFESDPFLNSNFGLVDFSQIGHQIKSLFFEVLSELICDGILEYIDCSYMGIYLFDFVQFGNLIFSKIDIGKAGKIGKRIKNWFNFIISYWQSVEIW